MRRYIFIVTLLFTLASAGVNAQNLPERGEVRRGNKAYNKEEYPTAAEHYARAAAYDPECYEAQFNLANALLKSEKAAEAEKILTTLAADSLRQSSDIAEAYFNLGNSQFAQKKLKEALESYKNSMRHNPTDQEAKYNYAYTKALMDQNEQNQDQDQQQNQDDQDKKDGDQGENGDQQQDQQNQDQKDQGDQGDDQQNQDQQDQNGDQDQQDQDQNGEPQPSGGESTQEQQQMLDAIQAQEDKTQEKLDKEARGVIIPGGKNW